VNHVDFQYDLPEEAISTYPVTPRSAARLLHRTGAGALSDYSFADLPDLLDGYDQLWVNDTRVIRARLLLTKPSGGRIEFFLLEPAALSMEQALGAYVSVTWRCMVRGGKRWSTGTADFETERLKIEAQSESSSEDGTWLIRFSWQADGERLTFGETIEQLGHIPLPPYMRRPDEDADAEEYQTIFASVPGSVAAPTAGLHYDESLRAALAARIDIHTCTLHVGAGTFKPLTDGAVSDHVMHGEYCELGLAEVRALAKPGTRRVVTGTTSLRTLESAYWCALRWKIEGVAPAVLDQWTPYGPGDLTKHAHKMSFAEAMHWVSEAMEENGNASWSFRTSLMMIPGYQIRSAQALITNFHLPQSTLLCLVSAAIGPSWKQMYKHALDQHYRFLSYGDGMLLEGLIPNVENEA
jgi:S-adenosylmethionine:tRNA ribosyltransferase-isomerase